MEKVIFPEMKSNLFLFPGNVRTTDIAKVCLLIPAVVSMLVTLASVLRFNPVSFQFSYQCSLFHVISSVQTCEETPPARVAVSF